MVSRQAEIYPKGLKPGCGGFFLFWLLALGSLGSPVTAQVTVPPAGESGIIEKSLRQSRPQFQPPAVNIPEIIIKDSRSVKDPGAGPAFFVRGVDIEGNTLFDDATLAALIDLGEDGLNLTLGILNLLAQEITAFYSQEGYILTRVFIPEQEVVDGVVRILVVEGELADIEITGNQRIPSEDILARMQPLRRDKILKEETLSKILLDLNDAMGLKVKSVLKPGEKTGTTDLNLQVEESRPFSIAFDMDNFGSRFTGEQRYGVTGQVGNLFFLGDRFSVRGVKSNEDQDYLSPTYTFPINNMGTTVRLSFIYSEFALGESLAALKAGGESTSYTGTVTHSLHRSHRAEFHVSFGMEYRQFKNFDFTGATSNDKLADGFLSAGGFFSDALRARTFYSLRVQQGFSERNTDDSLNSRASGHGDVVIASINFTRYQSAYIGRTYFILKGTGQVAGDRVLSPDQLAVGGFGTVRGHPLAEAAGDHGFAVSAEYVVPFPIKIPLTSNPQIKSLDQILSIHGFIDHGRVFVRNKQPGEVDRSITGAGAGLSLNFPRLDQDYPFWSFIFDVGFPVFGTPSPGVSSYTVYLGGQITY